MSPDDPPVPCADCGTPTPRSEMFGHGAELRCPDCAEVLRERLHPSRIRRAASSGRLHSGRPRVTGMLLGLIVVIWVAQQIPQVASVLDPWIRKIWRVTAADGSVTYRLFGLWQPALWSVTHTEIWHLGMNGFFLWRIGPWIELGWGGAMLAFLVLGSAIFGTTAGWLINGVRTIGISGGLFAVIGWLIALRRHHPVATAFVTPTFWNAVLANVVLLVVISEVGGIGISHVGHAAGFAWGFLAGVIARRSRPLPLFLLLGLATLALLVVAPDMEPLGWKTSVSGKG